MKKNTLDSAIEQMKFGSKKGFLNFYRGTVSYVYSSAYLLYKDRDEALRFMEDLYIYMYLHITDYKGDGDVKRWVSKELMERYRQLMIGKEMSDISAVKAMQESVELDANGKKMLELALLSNISFPPQSSGISATWVMMAALFLAGVVILTYLLASNLKTEKTIDADILTETQGGAKEAVSSDVSSDETEAGGLKTLSEAQAELEQYLEVYGEPEEDDDKSVTEVIHSEELDGATERIEKDSPDVPETPKAETPQIETPEEPQAGDSSKDNAGSDSRKTGGKKKDNSASDDPNARIDEFMEKVEKLENYTISQ